MKRRTAERGSVMIAALGMSVLCAGLATVMIRTAVLAKKDCDARWNRAQCLALARAGIANSYLDIQRGNTGVLGTALNPLAYSSGGYWVDASIGADGNVSLNSHGVCAGQSVTVSAAVEDIFRPVFDHAMYAGNSSGDPLYAMKFGGTGSQADRIVGDVYSGNNIASTGTASVTGTLRAKGSITGLLGTIGLTQPGPSLSTMNYAVNNDVNVAQRFASVSTNTSSPFGGSARQLPASDAAHIFRKNPSDRVAQTLLTAKDDYFLEDPTQTPSGSSTVDAAHASPVQLTMGSGVNRGNQVVYYIDGNLWIHSSQTLSFTLKHNDPAGVQVTFAVRGNIYVMDNLIRTDPVKDAYLLIALKDPAVPDSGNVYFGDVLYGTLKRIEAYLYAENNFYDNNIDAAGSATLSVTGVLSAGNQVAINRDFGTSHVKLDLTYDPRAALGTVTLPGMPPLLAGNSTHSYTLAGQWRAGQ